MPEDFSALAVACPYCGAHPGFTCDWGPSMKHMEPNAHWARRSVLVGEEQERAAKKVSSPPGVIPIRKEYPHEVQEHMVGREMKLLDAAESPLTEEEFDLAASLVGDHIGTGWADPEWPTNQDLARLAAKLRWQAEKSRQEKHV